MKKQQKSKKRNEPILVENHSQPPGALWLEKPQGKVPQKPVVDSTKTAQPMRGRGPQEAPGEDSDSSGGIEHLPSIASLGFSKQDEKQID